MSSIFIFSFDARPLLLHDGYTAHVSRNALENYLSGGYLLDPFYVASSHNHPSGLWRMNELAPDSFFSSDFLVSPDVHPCVSSEAGSLVEEIGFLIPLEPGLMAAYSLMRTHGSPAFLEEEVGSLKSVEPIIEKSINKHWRHERPEAFKFRSGVASEDIESAFTEAFADTLTPKQRDIVRMILRGHSSLSISIKLGISEGTAKLHRANIYSRLGISSQSELFRKFIDHLTRSSPVA
jgi:DNA-binding CsgD family transcriptional regulator